MATVTVERLREVLCYEPESGALTWRSSRPVIRCLAGGPAGRVDAEGYVRVYVDCKALKGHRVAWALHHGEWPSGNLDHINGIRNDNRIANLRVADYFQNQANTGLRSSSTTGLKGVCRRKNGRWSAQIRVRGEQLYLGSFISKEEAAKVYQAAAEKHFGEFARKPSNQ